MHFIGLSDMQVLDHISMFPQTVGSLNLIA